MTPDTALHPVGGWGNQDPGCILGNSVSHSEQSQYVSHLTQSEDSVIQITELNDLDSDDLIESPVSACINAKVYQRYSEQVISDRKDRWPNLSLAAAAAPELYVYNVCRDAATHNMLGPRVPVPTSNKADAWKNISTGHQDDAWLIDAIKFGFPMQYRGPPLYNERVPNHPSAMNFKQHVEEYIRKEKQLGAIVGPFDSPPFEPWCNVAPMMSREKPNKIDRRIIVDLSFPPGNGPNHFIEKNSVFGCSVSHTLPSVNDAINIITTLDFNVLLCSVDIARAYRNFALDPLDWPLNCISIDQQYYIDIRMPFGSRASSLYMQRMACMIQRTLLRQDILTVVYLDDMLVICPEGEDPRKKFLDVTTTLRSLGLPIAWEKVVSPTKCIRFLGITIDVDRREIRMPEEKITSFLSLVTQIRHRKWISTKTLQSVIGHINHLGKAVPPARHFMNRLLAALRDAKGGAIRVDSSLSRELEWFNNFLSAYNGRSLIVDPTPSIVIEADSCLSGGGARMNHLCYAFEYPGNIAQKLHITHLEALNCLVAARTFLPECHDTCVSIVCDSKGAVCALAGGRAKDLVLASIARAFWFLAARHNIKFKFNHAPGTSMVVADALSRQHLGQNESAKAAKIVDELCLQYVHVNAKDCDYASF